jgi:hypothetical protein
MDEMETRRRAKRFPIAASMLFRERSASEWRLASTVNLSHLGVLFRADGPLPAMGHAVDFIVTLPMNGLAQPPQVHCTGHIVRIAPEELAGGGHAVAITVDGYTFEDRLPV